MLSQDCRCHEYKWHDTTSISTPKHNGSRQFCWPSLSVSASYQQICLSARLSFYGLPFRVWFQKKNTLWNLKEKDNDCCAMITKLPLFNAFILRAWSCSTKKKKKGLTVKQLSWKQSHSNRNLPLMMVTNSNFLLRVRVGYSTSGFLPGYIFKLWQSIKVQ